LKQLALSLLLLPTAILGQQSNPVCKPESVPAAIQSRLNFEFSDWKIENYTDLDKPALERWIAEQPVACPGLAVGRFHESPTSSIALLLIPRTSQVTGYRFLIFTRVPGKPAYTMESIDVAADERAAPYLFIRKVKLSATYDLPSLRRFKIHAADGIMLAAAGRSEYEIDIYYWSNGKFQYSAIDR
jgi:hypothetical protein